MPAKKPATRTTSKIPKGMVTVAQASELLGITQQGVRSAIKRGELVAKRHGKQILLKRDAVTEARRKRIEFYSRPARSEVAVSDEEFLRRLWESDPDD